MAVIDPILGQGIRGQSLHAMENAINAVPSGIAVWDSSDRLIYANPQYSNFVGDFAASLQPGIKFEDMLKSGASGALAVAPRDKIQTFIEDRLRIHRSRCGLVEAAQNGRWYQISESPTEDGGVITCVTDVTTIRNRELTLCERKQLFESTLNSLDQGLCVFDANLTLRLWNRRYVELCCFPESMVGIGTRLEDLFRFNVALGIFGPGDPDEILKYKMAQVRQTGKAAYTRPTTAGKTLFVTSERLPDGGVVATFTDITELKKSEDALRESEARLRSIADNLPGVVYQRVLKSDGSLAFSFVSDGIKNIYGAEMTPERVTRDPSFFLETIDTGDRRDFLLSVMRSAADLTEWDQEFRIVATDGATKWMRGRSRPRKVENGDVVWDGVLLDVSARKAAAAELAALEAQLNHAQKLEALGTLVGGITHEINNALTPILMYGKLVLDSLPEGSRERRNMDRVNAQAHRIRDLVRQVLEFSQSTGRDAPSVDVVEIVRSGMHMLRSIVPSTIVVDVALPDTTLMVKAHPAQLTQILTNLVTNASQAIGGATGKIGVALSCEIPPTGRQRVAALGNPDTRTRYARLRIVDDGSGMDQATLARIFDPFFTTRPVGRGTGLGLSTVQRFVRNWNGIIDVTSQPGRGACFDIYIPLVGARASAKGRTRPAAV